MFIYLRSGSLHLIQCEFCCFMRALSARVVSLSVVYTSVSSLLSRIEVMLIPAACVCSVDLKHLCVDEFYSFELQSSCSLYRERI